MATVLITNSNAESKNPDTGLPDQPITSSNPFQKIDFHLAKKPFTGFTVNGGGGGFRLETLNPTTAASSHSLQKPGGGSNQVNGPLPGNGKTREGSEFPEKGLDPVLSLRVRVRRIGAGLENLGNTCFLNSVLQCLTYTEPLVAYLQSSRHQTSCRCAGFCALCAMQKHVSRAIQMPGRSLAPKDLVLNLRCISRSFRNSRQEDAHEYMVNLLESMHKCCLPSGVPSESPSAYERSLVHKIFGGSLRSQVKCMQCSFCSDKFDPFLDLSLEIIKADNVKKALANFTAKEHLDGGERQYQCQRCKQKVKALKQLTIHKAPNILTIHLKRFGSHISGQKIDKKIHFAPTLDLKPFVTGPYDGDLEYTLYGVLVHAGWSTHSGHYYCFVRPSSGLWYSLDDNKVVQVSERKVFEQKAYMLFYCRDRKSYGSKKAVDVMQNEMIIDSITRNGTFSNFNGVGADIRSDMIAKTSNAPNSSAAVALKDTLTTGASVESIAKKASGKQIDCSKVCSEPIKEPCPETSPKVTPLRSVMNGPSTLHQKADPSLPISSLSVAGPIDVLKPEDAMNMLAGPKFVDCSMESRTKKQPSNSIAIPSSCKYSEVTETVKDKSEAISLPLCREGNCSTNKDLWDSPAIAINRSIESSSLGGVCTVEKTSIKVEGFSSKHTDAAADDNKRKIDIVSAVLPSIPEMKSISSKQKARNQKPNRKLKNSFMSFQVTSIHLGSNILIGTSLSLWKKKKYKRGKQRTRCVKTLNQEHLVGLGPSSSEKLKTVAMGGSVHTPGKGLKHRKGEKVDVEKSSVRISSKDTSVSTVEREFRERVDKHGPVLATVDEFEKSSSGSLRGSLSDNKGEISSIDSQRSPTQNGFRNMDCQRGPSQNRFLHMLTRGLEETTLARWDEVESTPVRMMESNVKKSVSIGYVADEWDEEYDRGKRKKVRMPKDKFDGQNPFQEIATKKAKLNHAKFDQSRSGNRPLRIL